MPRTCSRRRNAGSSPPPASSPHWPRADHKIEITVGRVVHVPTGAVVWRTGPATVRCVKGAACCRRRAGSGSAAGAPRRGGLIRAGERLGAPPVAHWLAPAAEADSAKVPEPGGSLRRGHL